MREKKANNPDRLTFGQLALWNSRAVSVSIYVLISTFLLIYCTDTLKIPAGIISAILVGSKVLDAVTDAVAGFIVDRTKTKWGKGRPYEVFIIGMWICTFLLFACPESWSTTLKCVWIFIMYALTNSVCYTFLNACNTPYMVRAFKGSQMVKLTSYGSVITMLAAVVFNIAFPQMMGNIATSASGWRILIGGFAVAMGAIGILRMIFVSEKYDVDAVVNGGEEEKLEIKDIFTLIKTNKYILGLCVANLIFCFIANMGTITFYYTYIVGDVGLMSLASVVTFISIPLAFLFPKLIEKFSVVKLMFAGFLLSAAGYLLNFFAGANMPLLMIASFMTGTGTVPASMLIALAIIECADYNEWKGNPRMEGTMSSMTGLTSKVGSAIGAAGLGILLQIAGYTGDAATMPDSALVMIRMCFSLIPMVLYVIAAFSLSGYLKLDKMMPQIQRENEERRNNFSGASNNKEN